MKEILILLLLATITLHADSTEVILNPYENLDYDSINTYEIDSKPDCICPAQSYSNRPWYEL